jgi:6-phosphogluconolactonase
VQEKIIGLPPAFGDKIGGNMRLIIGSYASSDQPGIHFFQSEKSNASFKTVGNISGIANPSYVLLSTNHQYLYAITENKKNSAGKLSIYQLGQEGNAKTFIEAIDFLGAGSCYISTDAGGYHAFITNYGEGTLTVIRLPQLGKEGKVEQQVKFSGCGPNMERQNHPHPHAALLSKDERFLYCSDLGTDQLYRFLYTPNGRLPLQMENSTRLPPGSGPRHLAFSPNGKWLYLITELSGEIFVFDTAKPHLTLIQQIPLARQGAKGKTEGGDIQVHTAWFLYASNRGDANEIIAFMIDPESGKLQLLQHIGVDGVSPRSILICEQEGLLVVANEQSNNVSFFKIQNNGFLELTSEKLLIPAPSCIKAV